MGIRLNCQCGRELNVKDALAGKKGKCPDCGAVINVPTLEEAARLEKARTEAEAAEAAAQVKAEAEAEAEMIECPHCQKKIAPDSVICIGCGTNLKTGEKVGEGAAEGPAGADDQFDFFKVVPDILTTPTQALGTIIEADPTPANFQKAVILLAIGLAVFAWVSPLCGDVTIRGGEIAWWVYVIAIVLAVVAIVIDGILAQVAGSMFGSTGAGFANVLMAIIGSRALVSIALVLPGLYVMVSGGSALVWVVLFLQIVIRLVWGSILFALILSRGHGVPMVQSVCFAGGSAVIRILLFTAPGWFTEFSLLYQASS